jgi:hypothetical protein
VSDDGPGLTIALGVADDASAMICAYMDRDGPATVRIRAATADPGMLTSCLARLSATILGSLPPDLADQALATAKDLLINEIRQDFAEHQDEAGPAH